MNKLREFMKKYNWLWIIVIVIVAIVGDSYLQKPKTTTQISPTPNAQRASFKNIIPGIASESDLNKIWGTPLRTNIKGSERTNEYKSTSELRRHIVIIQNEKIVFIKEIVSAHDTNKSSDIVNIYGTATTTLYAKGPNSTFNLYVYPSNGIAYLGHKDGTLLEIWYFQPISISDFISKWGQDYSIRASSEQLH